jgi:hypothetical protein
MHTTTIAQIASCYHPLFFLMYSKFKENENKPKSL